MENQELPDIYRIIKFKNGEAVICKATRNTESNKAIDIEFPLQYNSNPTKMKDGSIGSAVNFQTWMPFAEESDYTIGLDNVLAVGTPCQDLIDRYTEAVNQFTASKNRSQEKEEVLEEDAQQPPAKNTMDTLPIGGMPVSQFENFINNILNSKNPNHHMEEMGEMYDDGDDDDFEFDTLQSHPIFEDISLTSNMKNKDSDEFKHRPRFDFGLEDDEDDISEI